MIRIRMHISKSSSCDPFSAKHFSRNALCKVRAPVISSISSHDSRSSSSMHVTPPCAEASWRLQGRCNGNGGESVTIMVSDFCPECEADHLDLQALTYNQVRSQFGQRIAWTVIQVMVQQGDLGHPIGMMEGRTPILCESNCCRSCHILVQLAWTDSLLLLLLQVHQFSCLENNLNIF